MHSRAVGPSTSNASRALSVASGVNPQAMALAEPEGGERQHECQEAHAL